MAYCKTWQRDVVSTDKTFSRVLSFVVKYSFQLFMDCIRPSDIFVSKQILLETDCKQGNLELSQLF